MFYYIITWTAYQQKLIMDRIDILEEKHILG